METLSNIIPVDFKAESMTADDGPPATLPGNSKSGRYWYGKTPGSKPLKLGKNGIPELLNQV